jgi:prepilin-type N-terminal cleavage/methylation domain-containing protein
MSIYTYRSIKTQSGFTILETLISVAILGAIVVALGSFMFNVFDQNRFLSASISSEQEGRIVLKTFATELRSASLSSNGSYPILSASSTAIIFYSDLNNDGQKEQVRYFMSGTTLKKGVIQPSVTAPPDYAGAEVVTDMVHNITNAGAGIFSYYDSSYDGTSAALTFPVTISSIRLVKVNLVIDADPIKSPSAINITTQTSVRNLKDNL